MTETIFYDGNCGLCHRGVRLVLAVDRAGKAFRFAPIDSAAFRAAVPEAIIATLPDSMIVRRADGVFLSRSAALIHILRRAGGVWRLLAAVAGFIPSSIRNLVYDGIARRRHRFFKPPNAACPVIPQHLRDRFDI